METLSGPQIWQNLFVPKLHEQYRKEVPSTLKFEKMITDLGGTLYLDHGATRTPSKELFEFLTRLGKAMGLEVLGKYDFPEKKLTAVAMQFPDKEGFKWFSTLIQYEKFSPEAQAAIKEDLARCDNQFSPRAMELLKMLENTGNLNTKDAKEFTEYLEAVFFKRQGRPVKRSTLELIKKESQETYNALLMGPAFNHVAYTVNELLINDWYGQEVIEILYEKMKAEGFSMLDSIQGTPGGVLRQTSTLADDIIFTVEEDDDSPGEIRTPGKFLEFIQRGVERDNDNRPVFEDGKVKRFRGFVAGNTVKLYDSTKG